MKRVASTASEAHPLYAVVSLLGDHNLEDGTPAPATEPPAAGGDGAGQQAAGSEGSAS